MPKLKECPDIPRLQRLVKNGCNASQIAGIFEVSHNTATWWVRAYCSEDERANEVRIEAAKRRQMLVGD